MKGLDLIINFEDDKAYLTKEKIFTLSELKFPAIAQRFKSPASWKVRVISYNNQNKKIYVEVLSYSTFKQPFLYHQLFPDVDMECIEQMGFRSIDTNALLQTLNGSGKRTISAPEAASIPSWHVSQESYYPTTVSKKETTMLTIRQSFLIPVKHILFKKGCVSFDKRVEQLGEVINFVVYNDNIIEEFDAIKNYFGNALKVKSIQFDISIQITNGEIASVESASPDIARIDQTLIESVRLKLVDSLLKNRIDNERDKQLFTIEELFDKVIGAQIKASVFYENVSKFLDDLLQISDTKHYKHLRFLSSRHAHLTMKLRFAIRPFSFIFLVEGKNKYHIVWETLNTTEATYIWSEDKDEEKLKTLLERADKTISAIKAQGRKTYINATEDNFRRVYHDYSDLIDGFKKWKTELEMVIAQ
jgi:hypothetical protein